MRYSRMKWISQFGLAFLALALMPLMAVGQGTVQNVKATAGTPSPEWSPWGQPTGITLSAQADAPTPDEGSTLKVPNWKWTVKTVESSDDGVSFTVGSNYTYTISNPDSANASLSVKFTYGAYWRITCQVTVGYSETPGGTTWAGTATCVSQPNSGQLVSITVASGANQTNVSQTAGSGYPNWTTVKTAGSIVVVEATVKPNTVDVANMIKWTGGTPRQANNLVSEVDKGISAMTAVTAEIGGSGPTEVDIWVLWATIVNQVTDKTPANAVQFGTRYDGTENLGVQAYDNGNTARGKMVPIATVTPEGVNAVLTGGFALRRDKLRHDFVDGAKDANRYDSDWVPDYSDMTRLFSAPPITTDNTAPLKLDPSDKCYGRDAPNITNFAGVTYSYERYDNFRQYLLWNGFTCSDYAGWYFKAAWVKNDAGTNQVKLDVTVVDQGALDLDTYQMAKYPPP